MSTRALLCALLLCACLEQAEETPGYSARVLRSGARVPRAEDDELLAKQIAASVPSQGGGQGQGQGGESMPAPLRTGFAGTREVLYWDLGTAGDSVKPVFVLARGGQPIEHLPIVDSLPGDDNYGPMRAVFTVEVTSRYRGELLTSLLALEDAVELGLVREPTRDGSYVSYPIVPKGFALARIDEPPLAARELYAKGVIASYLPLSMPAPLEGPFAPSLPAYVLQRQHELDPLDESTQQMDLNGDGDQLDSNTIFELEDLAQSASGLWSGLLVKVPADYALGAVRSGGQLFDESEAADAGAGHDGGSDAGVVHIGSPLLDVSALDELLFRPLYREASP